MEIDTSFLTFSPKRRQRRIVHKQLSKLSLKNSKKQDNPEKLEECSNKQKLTSMRDDYLSGSVGCCSSYIGKASRGDSSNIEVNGSVPVDSDKSEKLATGTFSPSVLRTNPLNSDSKGCELLASNSGSEKNEVQNNNLKTVVIDSSGSNCSSARSIKNSTSVISGKDEQNLIDVLKWLNENDFNSSKNNLTSCSSTSVMNTSIPVSASFNSPNGDSACTVLNELYGKNWDKKSVLKKKCVTDLKESKKNNSYRKVVDISTSSDDNFEEFLKSVKKTQNIRSTSLSQSNSFIADDSAESSNSLEFYISTTRKLTRTVEKKLSDLRPVRLKFSSSDDDTEDETSPALENISTKYKRKELGEQNAITRENVNASTGQACQSFIASLSSAVPVSNCHQDALKFRTNFKKHKEELTKLLFTIFNKEVFANKLPANMEIKWNVRLISTAGLCHNRILKNPGKENIFSSTIELSPKVCDNAERVRNTLIHEMCHAATYIIDKSESGGHGANWKAWTKRARRAFPALGPIEICHNYKIQKKFAYKCQNCGYKIERHSKSLKTDQIRCGYCMGKFELFVNAKSTKKDNVDTSRILKTPRNPNKFALFVKENYSVVKQSQSNLKHTEIMKLLGQQFSAIKISSSKDV